MHTSCKLLTAWHCMQALGLCSGTTHFFLFGTHTLFGPHTRSGMRRLWASAEVEDQYKHTATIPQLRLQRRQETGAGAGVVVAKNVLLFRVDSLEGDPIGTAVLIREW